MLKNIVIVLVDSLRVDGTNYNQKLIYGKQNYYSIKTPNLDNFSKKATNFINAYSTNTYTTSAIASLLTGKYPPIHGIRSFFDFNQRLNPNIKTLAENLNDFNFQTFFYSDISELFSLMDIWRGFKVKTYSNMDWLWNSINDLKKDRNFVFIHTFDVHEPYLFIEDNSADKKINDDYYEVITDLRKKIHFSSKINQRKKPHSAWTEIRKLVKLYQIDQAELFHEYYNKGVEKFDALRFPQIKNRLESLGLNEENTFFVILSDHGEGKTEFINNFNFAHSGELTEETTRIFLSTSNIGKTLANNLFSISFLKNLIINNVIYNKDVSFSNEKYIYAETFVYNLNENAPQMTNDTTRVINFNKKLKNNTSIVYNRGLIGKKYKIIIKNQPEKVDDLKKEKDFETLIKKSYQILFGRAPEKAAYDTYFKKLKTNEINKKIFIESLINSDEKKLKPFFSAYFIKLLEENRVNIDMAKFKSEIDKIFKLNTGNKLTFEKIKNYVKI